MPTHPAPLEVLRDQLAQHYLDRDQDECHLPHIAFTSLTTVTQGYYRAKADDVLPVISTWLATEAAACDQHLNDGALRCNQVGPHTTHTFDGRSPDDRHTNTEAVHT